MQIRNAKVTDINAILALSDQINHQHHLRCTYGVCAIKITFKQSRQRGVLAETIVDLLELSCRCWTGCSDWFLGKVTQNKGVGFIQSHKVASEHYCGGGPFGNRGVGRGAIEVIQSMGASSRAIELRLKMMEFNHEALRALWVAGGISPESCRCAF